MACSWPFSSEPAWRVGYHQVKNSQTPVTRPTPSPFETPPGLLRRGIQVPGPTLGSRACCVSHNCPNGVGTDDGKTIYSSAEESAAVSKGLLLFERSGEHYAATPVIAFSLVMPGFRDIGIEGKSPTQLRGLQKAVLSG